MLPARYTKGFFYPAREEGEVAWYEVREYARTIKAVPVGTLQHFYCPRKKRRFEGYFLDGRWITLGQLRDFARSGQLLETDDFLSFYEASGRTRAEICDAFPDPPPPPPPRPEPPQYEQPQIVADPCPTCPEHRPYEPFFDSRTIYETKGGDTVFIHIYKPATFFSAEEYLLTLSYLETGPGWEDNRTLVRHIAQKIVNAGSVRQIARILDTAVTEGTEMGVRVGVSIVDDVLSLMEFAKDPNASNAVGILPFICGGGKFLAKADEFDLPGGGGARKPKDGPDGNGGRRQPDGDRRQPDGANGSGERAGRDGDGPHSDPDVWPNRNPNARPPGTRILDPRRHFTDTKFTGYADYVVVVGGEVRLGKSHAYLADSDGVIAAGRARFDGGELRSLDNWSGHFLPHGVDPTVPERAFGKLGFDAEGLYKEIVRPK